MTPRMTLARRYMLASFVILVLSAVGIGWWVGKQIERGVTHRTGATSALYVSSFVAPQLRGLAERSSLSPQQVTELDDLLQHTPLEREIVAFKVWGRGGRLLYSTNRDQMGRTFPVTASLRRAWAGEVSSRVSALEEAENVAERERSDRLLETYSPIYGTGTRTVVAVAEFYHRVDELEREITAAQRQSWLGVGLAFALAYLLLAGMVGRASDTIVRQQDQLREKVETLTRLLGRNRELASRVQLAANRTTALNERYLRRISAELHDGPAQQISLALLRLDSVAEHHAGGGELRVSGPDIPADVERMRLSLNHALAEIRTISSGLRLPELDRLTLAQTLERVVRVHERRSGTQVAVTRGELPEDASLPLKITLYRVVEEALNNAHRHAGGVGQHVRVTTQDGRLCLEISDRGPGLNGQRAGDGQEHLGLLGMRERVEGLGGTFRAESPPEGGTRIVAELPLEVTEHALD
ncbi:MAG: sensor histidine kinase [Chloroflexota bacterium]|nr:sensor histidine kinase [Chloroflexota bacterium]